MADNPLGKVPVLVTPDGAMIGSLLCCEYLESKAGSSSFTSRTAASRWRVAHLHALADGVMEAAVAHVTEALRRPAPLVHAGSLDRQASKIRRTLDVLESQMRGRESAIDIASITLACALAYLDFRIPELSWQPSHPELRAWSAAFACRPSMQSTRPFHPPRNNTRA
jgi:glutathione S-transferase